MKIFDGKIKVGEVHGPLGTVDPLFYKGLGACVARCILIA